MDQTQAFQPHFGPSFSLLSLFTPQAVHLVFAAALVLFLAASAILLYHWFRYNVGIFRTALVIAVYGGGSFVLLAAAYSASILF